MNHVQEALKVLRDLRERNLSEAAASPEHEKQKISADDASSRAGKWSRHITSDRMETATAAELRRIHSNAADAHAAAQKHYPTTDVKHHIHKLTALHHAKMAAMLSSYA